MALATLLEKQECRTLRGNRTAVETFCGISVLSIIFVVRSAKSNFFGGVWGGLISCSFATLILQ